MSNEEEIPTGGLWSNGDTPKSGWICEGVNDLGSEHQLCQMCGRRWIRFQHIMLHADHAEVLAGRICAGKMEGDLDAATSRERDAKRKARRRDHEEIDVEWRQSEAGNWWAKADDGWRLIVYTDKHNAWRFMFVKGEAQPLWQRPRYGTADEAKTAAARLFALYND